MGRLRVRYERAMAPIGRFLSATGLPPSSMTLLSLIIALISAYFYIRGRAALGGGFIVLTGVFDMFDGAIARALGKTSGFGATLDHVADRYAECIVLFGIIYGGLAPWWWGLFTIFGMIMASFTRAKAESVGGLSSCTVGVAERQEKLIILVAGSILNTFLVNALKYSIILVGVLSHITVIQRLHYTWKKMEVD